MIKWTWKELREVLKYYKITMEGKCFGDSEIEWQEKFEIVIENVVSKINDCISNFISLNNLSSHKEINDGAIIEIDWNKLAYLPLNYYPMYYLKERQLHYQKLLTKINNTIKQKEKNNSKGISFDFLSD